MATMNLKNVNKIYPNGVQAVFDFNLEIKDGEFIVFVGPSGCGKSTTLRMIAGLEEISSGDLFIDDERVNDRAPKDRDISMVFQNYALYAHMTVYHNMAFSLTLRKDDSDVIHERVMWAADILNLKPYLNRKPAHLSGGQRQRVAVGRAIVRNPKIFLFDEPLSNLDAKLRNTMRQEFKILHHQLKSTMIYVTHDQIEALTLADRIVIMDKGYIQQVGTPTEIYQDPKNLFVAKFIGTPPMNFLTGSVNKEGIFTLNDEGTTLKLDSKIVSFLGKQNYINKKIVMGIRPEHVKVEHKSKYTQGYDSKVKIYELLGATALVHFPVGNQVIISKINVRENLKSGTDISFDFDLNNLYFFDAETEKRIYGND